MDLTLLRSKEGPGRQALLACEAGACKVQAGRLSGGMKRKLSLGHWDVRFCGFACLRRLSMNANVEGSLEFTPHFSSYVALLSFVDINF